MIEIIDSLDVNLWDSFVYSHPQGNIFQTSIINKVYHKTKNYNPICLAAFDSSSDEILALMQAIVVSEFSGFLLPFSSRSVVHGGPLFHDSDKGRAAVKMLVEHYNQLINSKIVYTQIRNMWDTNYDRQMFISHGYGYEDHLDFLINLNKKEEELWQEIHKSRRKGINRAEKCGICIRKVNSIEELLSCYELVADTYKRFKNPIADVSLFKASYECLVPEGFADFFIALKDDVIVGTRITLNYKEMVYDWYAGSKLDTDYVDEALVWHILKENAGKYDVFDFGGAGHPDKPYGVREFKRRFGGEMVNFGRYEIVHSEIRRKVAMAGLKVHSLLK